MKNFLVVLFAALLTVGAAHAQKTRIYGVVKDATSAEPLISANVVYGEGLGVVTDLDGKFSVSVPNGDYTIQISYIGYEAISKTVKANGGQLELNFALKTVTLNEVTVVADIAIDRETPVAFSNIEPMKIQEELSSQEIPMLLNSTPGVYATQQGGGAGDARVTIRGFSQRNISVQIDGVPMNDMENGWVYWSNWFGLDGVTQRIQVQRGLGASKLSIPAVGGSMNILTTGITSKRSTEINLTVGNNGLIRTKIGFNSGRLKGGWGVTAAFAYDRQDGWVEATWASRFFYYLKLQKQIGNHTLSVSGMGAPQERGQRPWMEQIHMYDRAYAESLGVDFNHSSVTTDERPGNYGLRYNAQWGNVTRNRNDPNAMSDMQSVAVNFYHKPIFSFKHFWAKGKWAVSNIVYGSLGRGGGTSMKGGAADQDLETGLWDLNGIYQVNITGGPFDTPYDLGAVDDTSKYKATKYIRANMNNHYWYGLLSTINHKFNDAWDLAVGIDFRAFSVEKYATPYDMLGGDYVVFNPENSGEGELFYPNDPEYNVKRPGDISGFRTRSSVYNAGLFAQLEYSKDKFSGFVSVSGGNNSYIRTDRMRKRDLVLADTTYERALGLNDTIVHNGQIYTHKSEEARIATRDWIHFQGGTAKFGVNYNINKHMNVFFNGGAFFRPPTIRDVYSGNSYDIVEGVGTEIAWGVELGYSVKYPRWAANLNLYRTTWENRPVQATENVGGDAVRVNLPNLGSVHQGVEVDAVYKTPWFFDVEGLISYGDWRWKGKALAYQYANGGSTPTQVDTIDVNGVHIGDAAQFQVAGSIKIKPVKGAYVKAQVTYFDNYFSNFRVLHLQNENGGRDSWQIPAYYLLDIHAGWTIKLKKMDVMLRGSVLNVTGNRYISDAQNNGAGGTPQTFDATTATVFMGQGRRWTVTVGVKF